MTDKTSAHPKEIFLKLKMFFAQQLRAFIAIDFVAP